jgi:hypothetical protein
MQEIWAEHTANEAAQAQEDEDGKRDITIIAGNDDKPYALDWSLSPHSTTWDSPNATKYMAADIPRLSSTMLHLEEESEEEVDSTIGLLDT